MDSVRLICAHSFHVIFRLGSLGTNHISTAPPAVPDSATKYTDTEATGGLQSVSLRRRDETLWCGALPPPLFVSESEYQLDRFSFILV